LSDEKALKEEVMSYFSKSPSGLPGFNYSKLVHQKFVIDYIQGKLHQPLVLDVGCGNGRFQENIPSVGIDLSLERLRISAKKYRQSDFLQADANNLPFFDDSFQVVHFASSLMHVPNAADALNESYRVLEDKGQIILFEPSIDFFGVKLRSYSQKNLFHQFFGANLISMLKTKGFKINRVKRCLCYWPHVILNMVPLSVLFGLENLMLPVFKMQLLVVAEKQQL
jgi:ubiquinone/menaquinone biosynthesis C-methylase UbiE